MTKKDEWNGIKIFELNCANPRYINIWMNEN